MGVGEDALALHLTRPHQGDGNVIVAADVPHGAERAGAQRTVNRRLRHERRTPQDGALPGSMILRPLAGRQCRAAHVAGTVLWSRGVLLALTALYSACAWSLLLTSLIE